MSTTLDTIFEKSIPSDLEINKEEFFKIQYTEPITSVRLNPLKRIHQFDEEENITWCLDGKYLKTRPNFTADPLFHAGCYYVQEASSMFLEFVLKQLVDFSKQLIVLDLCAAPGGKTTLISSLLNDESLLIANEVIQSRVNILKENCIKWGTMNTWISNCDAHYFGKLKNYFDLLVIDAPCSGSGLFRKIPTYLDDWTEENVNLCVHRQKRILHDCYDALAQNGILVYMTCSFSKEENEEIVDYILDEFDVVSCEIPTVKSWGIIETKSEKKQGYGYRFFPHLTKGEGFFLACFKKNDGNEKYIPIEKMNVKLTFQDAVLEEFVDMKNKFSWNQNGNILLVHQKHLSYFQDFSTQIKLVKKGILAGQIIRNELIPDHELAMYFAYKKSINSVELTLNEAILYLKKDNNLKIDDSKGWLLVKYKNQSLGWVKNLGNRANNYYPINYRILNKNILTS